MNLFEELDTLDPSFKLEPPRIETPTAHKITVLILLKQYVIVGAPTYLLRENQLLTFINF